MGLALKAEFIKVEKNECQMRSRWILHKACRQLHHFALPKSHSIKKRSPLNSISKEAIALLDLARDNLLALNS